MNQKAEGSLRRQDGRTAGQIDFWEPVFRSSHFLTTELTDPGSVADRPVSGGTWFSERELRIRSFHRFLSNLSHFCRTEPYPHPDVSFQRRNPTRKITIQVFHIQREDADRICLVDRAENSGNPQHYCDIRDFFGVSGDFWPFARRLATQAGEFLWRAAI